MRRQSLRPLCSNVRRFDDQAVNARRSTDRRSHRECCISVCLFGSRSTGVLLKACRRRSGTVTPGIGLEGAVHINFTTIAHEVPNSGGEQDNQQADDDCVSRTECKKHFHDIARFYYEPAVQSSVTSCSASSHASAAADDVELRCKTGVLACNDWKSAVPHSVI